MQEGEPMNLLEKKTVPVCCDGFEPSGTMHIAQCNIRDIQSWTGSYEGDQCEQAGFSWVLCENTDCQLNNKMGGDLKKIQTVGRYLIEI
ncbi:tRNA synthetases class I (W and Y) [Musa troglodytarum]|uniref:tyrosine--tRNA ligase n=1 Tax=Musa troglodytarum TaxID=320322 RepID=A0A9E7JRW1_9LILI|nr:tRNA synthetases class I (W and Y) [Musa troglodytarum]